MLSHFPNVPHVHVDHINAPMDTLVLMRWRVILHIGSTIIPKPKGKTT